MTRMRAGSLIALAVLAILPFLPGLFYPFVFDDNGVITENAFLQDAANLYDTMLLRTIGSAQVIDGQRPAVILTYFSDVWAWGYEPAGFRITNYLVHSANTVLVLLLVLRLCQPSRLIAWLVSLMVAWHPLGIEVVHSPAFREDSLCLSGGLVFILAGTTARASWPLMLAGLAAFAFALLAKESGAMFVLLMVVLWFLFPGLRPGRVKITTLLAACFALLVMYGLLLNDRGSAQAIGERWNGVSLVGIERMLSPPWLFICSLARMIMPWPLSVDYRIIPVAALSDLRFWVGVSGVIALAIIGWKQRHARTAFFFGLSWMLVMFIPVSNAWPLFNPVADRYAYLLLPGLALVIARVMPGAKPARIAGLALMAIAFAWLIVLRIPDWKDERSLWRSALAVEPESARAHAWLGIIESAEGRTDLALSHYEAARTLNTQDPGPLVNIGVMKLGQGDRVAAEQCFRAALQLNPRQPQALENLALMGLAP